MLWNTPPSADLVLRDFIQRHDKQAIYVDVRYAGALAALAKLVHKGNKTDLINEMIEDLLKKYSDLLIEREDVVRTKEDEVRKKHHID
jgi:DNA-binding transcriptional regulator PaaX